MPLYSTTILNCIIEGVKMFDVYDPESPEEKVEEKECDNCEQLYKVVHATNEKPVFCPFCSEPLE